MRVLSIDGGGIRGLIPAMVLAELERRAGRPASTLFDLVAGTSTGGIIACALTAPGPSGAPRWRAAEVVDLYLREGPGIFARTLRRRVATADGLLDEKYDDAALDAALARYLGDTPLSAALTRVLVTAYDLPSRSPWFFKSWRPERDAPMATVARATSAAPTYFEPTAVGALGLIDGGVFATNPALCAYAEAARLGVGRDDVVLVSLGTGRLTRPIAVDDARGWGRVEWVRPLIDIVFDGVADTVDYQLDHLLGDRHHRFQVELTRASDDLDDASAENLERLQAHARELIAGSEARLDALAEQLAGGATV